MAMSAEKQRAWKAANPEKVLANKARAEAKRIASGEACRAAKLAAQARYREKHLEEIRARKAVWRTANPEKEAAYMRKMRANRPEDKKESDRQYRRANPDKLAVSRAKYNATHRDKKRELGLRYYARLKASYEFAKLMGVI